MHWHNKWLKVSKAFTDLLCVIDNNGSIDGSQGDEDVTRCSQDLVLSNLCHLQQLTIKPT